MSRANIGWLGGSSADRTHLSGGAVAKWRRGQQQCPLSIRGGSMQLYPSRDHHMATHLRLLHVDGPEATIDGGSYGPEATIDGGS